MIEKTGHKDVQVKHEFLFASVTGAVRGEEEKHILIDTLSREIPGAYFDGSQLETSVAVPSEVTATLEADQSITLRGIVPDNDSKIMFGVAAASVRHVSEVNNLLEVPEKVEVPEWRNTAPQFMFRFFSEIGSRKMILDSIGMKLEGEVVSRELREQLGSEARTILSDPRVVQNFLTVRKLQPPTFRVSESADEVKLAGILPDEKTRIRLTEVVKQLNPKKEMVDEIRVSSGVARPWWLENAHNLILLLFQQTAGNGSLEFWADRVVLGGNVPDEGSIITITQAASAGKPDDFSVQSLLTIGPRMESTVVLIPEERGRFILSGTVANLAVKDEILSALMLDFPDAVIFDLLKVSSSVEPSSWKHPGSFFSHLLQNSQGGAVEIFQKGIVISGVVESEKVKSDLEASALSVIGKNGSVDNLLTVEEMIAEANGGKNASGRITHEVIYFESGSSQVGSSDDSKLRDFAGILGEKDEETKIILGAFHDPTGNAVSNKKLSLRRANSVRDRLIEFGVPGKQIKVEYKGVDDTNTNQSDLWKSRRVEIAID